MGNHPRILFHGTNRKYEREQRLQYGTYRHEADFGEVQLTKWSEWAINKAVESMYKYHTFGKEDGAAILVIDTQQLKSPVKAHTYPHGVVPAEGKWLTPELHPDAYEVISVISGLNQEVKKAIQEAIRTLMRAA